MSLSREQMLVEMGISPIWVLRESEPPVAEPVAAPLAVAAAEQPASAPPLPQPVAAQPAAPAAAPGMADIDALDWPELAKRVAACQACPLCQQRKQAVFGVGDLHPDWLFIGE